MFILIIVTHRLGQSIVTGEGPGATRSSPRGYLQWPATTRTRQRSSAVSPVSCRAHTLRAFRSPSTRLADPAATRENSVTTSSAARDSCGCQAGTARRPPRLPPSYFAPIREHVGMDEQTVAAPMTEGVVTAALDESLADLAARLVDHDIKSVVVTDDDRPVGILTSTDYLELVADGADPTTTTVGDRMTGEVVTVRYDETVRRAARLMADRGFNHLPVVDTGGGVVGIVSSTDLTRYLARGGN